MLQLWKHYPDTNSSERQQVCLHYNSNQCQQENSGNFSLIDQAGQKNLMLEQAVTSCLPEDCVLRIFHGRRSFSFRPGWWETANSQSQLLDHLLLPIGNSLHMPVPKGVGILLSHAVLGWQHKAAVAFFSKNHLLLLERAIVSLSPQCLISRDLWSADQANWASPGVKQRRRKRPHKAGTF